MTPQDALMQWLRVQMLRLRSFDWGRGSWTTHWLKDGVAKFGSNYTFDTLCTQLGVSEDDILTFIDSVPAVDEMEGKSFTASWTQNELTLSWLEEGISEKKTEALRSFPWVEGLWPHVPPPRLPGVLAREPSGRNMLVARPCGGLSPRCTGPHQCFSPRGLRRTRGAARRKTRPEPPSNAGSNPRKSRKSQN